MALALAPLTKGRLTARLAGGWADVQAALALRRLCFRTLRGLPPEGEGDAFDALSDHLLIQDGATTLATCRLRLLRAPDLAACYTGQFYDLSALTPLPALEIGRFCQAPGVSDPDPLRLTFAALTRLVDASGAGLLMGCSSFEGTSLAPYHTALAPFTDRLRPDTPPLAPEALALPNPPPVLPFDLGAPPVTDSPPSPSWGGAGRSESHATANAPLPPLLRHYLALGAQLSDHAVIDRTLQTCHVLTVLPVAAIPAPHARALRALAGP